MWTQAVNIFGVLKSSMCASPNPQVTILEIIGSHLMHQITPMQGEYLSVKTYK